MYNIGEVANMFQLTVSTLRYYDKIGLFTETIKRDPAGIRKFGDAQIETLTVIECLKKAGMQLEDIKRFLDWCKEGDQTIELGRELYYQRKKEVQEKMQELQNVMDFIDYKCWYYDTACAEHTEAKVKNIKPQEMPEEIRAKYERTHR